MQNLWKYLSWNVRFELHPTPGGTSPLPQRLWGGHLWGTPGLLQHAALLQGPGTFTSR